MTKYKMGDFWKRKKILLKPFYIRGKENTSNVNRKMSRKGFLGCWQPIVTKTKCNVYILSKIMKSSMFYITCRTGCVYFC